MIALAPSGSSGRENAVNGLRGLMLLIIVVTHYVPSAFFSGNIARPAAAVMLAVTGYFFMTIVDRERGFDGSVGARAGAAFSLFLQRHMRIWPVMIGVVLMYVALGFIDPSPTTTQIHRTWPLYALYLGNVVKMIFESEAFPAHFWLISAQEQFVVIALGSWIVVGPRRFGSFLKIAVVGGVVARIIGAMLWMPDNPALATESPFAIADAMALGMLCRIAITGGESKTRLRRRIVIGIIATLVIWATVPNTYAAYFGLVPLVTALVGCLFILVLADEVRVRHMKLGILSSAPVVLLGQMSLSLFLIHPLTNTLINLGFARATGSLMPWWALALVGPPASLLTAFLYFRAVEVPIRLLRRRSRSTKAEPRALHAAPAQIVPA